MRVARGEEGEEPPEQIQHERVDLHERAQHRALGAAGDKLSAMRGGVQAGRVETFFSTHPDPAARAQTVRNQIAQLPARNLRKDSPRFQELKRRVLGN